MSMKVIDQVVGIFVFMPSFDASYAGADYLFGSYWPTWTAGMIVVAATTASYGPYAGLAE